MAFIARLTSPLTFGKSVFSSRKQLCDNNIKLVFAKQIYPKCNSSLTSLSKSKRGE